ncbi:MAG: hypothetical protein ABS79_01910 [Planctomycetes bacterium SCN 63-9]|nr:MAG: hypothetical protein ABS79_01910 [Planctomycetes bacterium SCN 63-9]
MEKALFHIYRNAKSAEEKARAEEYLTRLYVEADLKAGLILAKDIRSDESLSSADDSSIPFLRCELLKQPLQGWNDPPLAKWPAPDPRLVQQIQDAQGMLQERFGFCQAMPLDQYLETSEFLRISGYRPTRLRPYADGSTLRVAAIWTRDGRKWAQAVGKPAEAIRQQDRTLRDQGLAPVDVAGHLEIGTNAPPTEVYSALWSEQEDGHSTRLLVDLTREERERVRASLLKENLAPRTLQAMMGIDGHARFSGVWGPSQIPSFGSDSLNARLDARYGEEQDETDPLLAVDLTWMSRDTANATGEADFHNALSDAEATLKANPYDISAHLRRAKALGTLSRWKEAMTDLDAIISMLEMERDNQQKLPLAYRRANPLLPKALGFRAIAHAQLKERTSAHADLAKFKTLEPSESYRLYTTAAVACALGEDGEKSFEAIEAALKRDLANPDLCYDAACAFALASTIGPDQDRRRAFAERGATLFAESLRQGYSDESNIRNDSDLDPIRDQPVFGNAFKSAGFDRECLAVRSADGAVKVAVVSEQGDGGNLERYRKLVDQNYRPIAISVIRSDITSPLSKAMIWHRPVGEEGIEELAKRQARAAISLFPRYSEYSREPHWMRTLVSLLRHGKDPRRRSFIMNSPVIGNRGSGLLALEEMDEVERMKRSTENRIGDELPPTPEPSIPPSGELLFHPETSILRAKILASIAPPVEADSSSSATAAAESILLPSANRVDLEKLLGLYQNHFDAGVHGAAEWALRNYGQVRIHIAFDSEDLTVEQHLKQADAKLASAEPAANRRWYVNKQGMCFSVIDGPVTFRMGSGTEGVGSGNDDLSHPVTIARRFAIAAREVTARQFEKFRSERAGNRPGTAIGASAAHPENPAVGVSWYEAAAFCNWLSKAEGIPEDQWCYVFPKDGSNREEIEIPENSLLRTGYRLPTEAEWEYSCRAGAITARPYGQTAELLDRYARFQANSQRMASVVGRLKPNDLGLFDMLGNAEEWCHDLFKPYSKGADRPVKDEFGDDRRIVSTRPRVLRGGSFADAASQLQSAGRKGDLPSTAGPTYGIRVARTLPVSFRPPLP